MSGLALDTDEKLNRAGVMICSGIGCLPVLDDGALVGILTESDLVRLLIRLLSDGPL